MEFICDSTASAICNSSSDLGKKNGSGFQLSKHTVNCSSFFSFPQMVLMHLMPSINSGQQ